MTRIPLSWNSRTNSNGIIHDENFKNILNFIKQGRIHQWILNFYGYNNNESIAFQKRLQNMLRQEIQDKNFLWITSEIQFFSSEAQHSPELFIQELEKIPNQQSGVIFLYEPIDYGYIISQHQSQKYLIHKKMASIFSEKNLLLLLFGNIPYDIHYFEDNSPLSQFVWKEFNIKAYEREELNVLKDLKSNIGETIVKHSSGNFEVIHGLETFWNEIHLENRVTDLVKNFLEIPLKTKVDKLVKDKLIALSNFLKNNKNEIQDKIQYIQNKKILFAKEKSSELFKAYFDKTALFDCHTEEIESKFFYELIPKNVFEPAIRESGFIKNKGRIKSISIKTNKYADEFAEIAAYFEFRNPTFIMGAGNSMVSGAPDRKRMFKLILKRIYPENKQLYEKMNFRELKENFQKLIDNGFARDDLRIRVRELLAGIKPSIGHFYLTQLVKAGKIDMIITTNFDTLLEDSLMDYGVRSRNFIQLVGEEDIPSDEWEWVNSFPNLLKIFKICGDIFYGSWLAVDDKTANQWIESVVNAMEKIGKYRDTHFFIILGHQFGEIDLSKIFEHKRTEDLKIIYANPSSSDCRRFRDLYEHKCGYLKLIHGHHGEFDHFMQELCQRLKKRGMT